MPGIGKTENGTGECPDDDNCEGDDECPGVANKLRDFYGKLSEKIVGVHILNDADNANNSNDTNKYK